MRESPQPTEVDMSPEAIDRRLRNVAQLFKVGMAIRNARSKPIVSSEDPGEHPGDENPHDRAGS